MKIRYNYFGDTMKIIGMIVEYNPLHNGHLIHFNKIKEKNPDLVIAIMSSSFSMRGDLSIFDKFKKTNQALTLGIDIVVELPLLESMQRADIFSLNAVRLLHDLGVDEIVIGSENNDISLYEKLYQDDIQSKSKEKSLKVTSNVSNLSSNDTLGYYYYKAIKDNDYQILLSTIKREISEYNDLTFHHEKIASATSIRNNINYIDQYTPNFVSKDKDFILNEEKLFDYIKYKILSTSLSDLANIFFVDEGIEYKLKDIKDFKNLDSFINYLSNKKYTKTRMKRMLMYILLNIKKDEVNKVENSSFIRVLGYSKKGKDYLSQIKHNLTLYTNIKEGLHPILDIELKVSKILDSIYNLDLLKQEQKGPILR